MTRQELAARVREIANNVLCDVEEHGVDENDAIWAQIDSTDLVVYPHKARAVVDALHYEEETEAFERLADFGYTLGGDGLESMGELMVKLAFVALENLVTRELERGE